MEHVAALIENEIPEHSIERLRDVICALDEEHRIVLSLYYLEGLNGAEIAEVLGTSEELVHEFLVGAVRVVRSHSRLTSPLRAA